VRQIDGAMTISPQGVRVAYQSFLFCTLLEIIASSPISSATPRYRLRQFQLTSPFKKVGLGETAERRLCVATVTAMSLKFGRIPGIVEQAVAVSE
jgi:hypothetical protein